MDSFGRFFSMIILFLGLIVTPLVLYGFLFDMYTNMRISNAGREFVDSSRAKGSITRDNLDEFYSEVYGYGGIYVSIDYGQCVVYAETDDNGNATGDVFKTVISYPEESMLAEIYPDNWSDSEPVPEFKMSTGDELHVTIKKKVGGIAAGFINLMSANKVVTVLNDYGGTVY